MDRAGDAHCFLVAAMSRRLGVPICDTIGSGWDARQGPRLLSALSADEVEHVAHIHCSGRRMQRAAARWLHIASEARVESIWEDPPPTDNFANRLYWTTIWVTYRQMQYSNGFAVLVVQTAFALQHALPYIVYDASAKKQARPNVSDDLCRLC